MHWSSTTRPSLLNRARCPDDRRAWREMEARYGELILRYCRARGVQHADAEDIRQIVLASLTSALTTFEYDPARGRFRSYVARATRNAIARRARGRSTRERSLDALHEDEATARSIEQNEPHDALWSRLWEDHHLRRAFDSVRRAIEPQSAAIFEALLAGVTTREIINRFDVSADAVAKVRQRVCARLRETVARQIAEEDHARSALAATD